MKQKTLLLLLIGLLLWFLQATVLAASPVLPGYGPFAVEITKDGQYGYLGFDLSETIYKVRLTDLTVVATADLSAYFPMESERIALDAAERKLFVYTPTWRKLLVLDAETMNLIHTLDDYSLIGMFRSQFGSQLVTWAGGNTVRFLDTDTYAVTEHTANDGIFFIKIEEHQADPAKWFVVTQGLPGGQGPTTVGVYDHVAKAWGNSVTFSPQGAGEGIFALRVLPNGQKAYVATFGGWYPEYHAYGWLYAVDFATKQVKVVPIDGGAMCLEANPAGTQLYVGAGWPLPNTNNLLVVDTASDSIVGPIPLGRNKYGWPYTQMNTLKIDPTDPRFLYATSADGNAFMKVDIGSSALAGVLVANNESFRPHFFVRRSAASTGNILIHQNAMSFELDLDNANIQKVVTFPAIRPDAYAYDIGALDTGRLLIAQGEHFLEVDKAAMQLVAKHPLPPGTPSIWHFAMADDMATIYTVTNSSGGIPNVFMALEASTFQVKKQMSLDGGGFMFRPFELPGGAKLYTLGGAQNGAIVVHVLSTADYVLQKTIMFDQPDRLGISTGPAYPYAYDPASHTLFVGATHVVLAIDTTTDTISKVIYLGDAATAFGLQPSQLTYLNAVGLVYSPTKNHLYIAHSDRSFVSVFDLTNDRFLPKLISLKGYGPSLLFANDAYSKIYSLNQRSDSVSVIDAESQTLEKVVDLHDNLVDFAFAKGWNLVGNSASEAIDVATRFGDSSKVLTVWKWLPTTNKWAFYAPSLDMQQLADYATANGYDVLTSIVSGEGFWVNAKADFTATRAGGTPILSAAFQPDAATGQSKLVSGWNLVATGDHKTPSAFNSAIGVASPAAGDIPINLTTLWAWDTTLANWYFYASSLEKSDGLANYIGAKGYLDFGTRVLGQTTGFWVRMP